jgi:uncharacterized protein YcnI
MNRFARRLAVTVGLGAVTLVAIAGPASAHTEAEAEAATAGRTRITFTAEAECAEGAEPTNSLRVQLPQGVTDVKPENQNGWSSNVTATELTWSAASPTIDQDTFTVEMVLAQPVGETVYLPTIQGCPNGEDIAWIQIPTAPGEQLEHPAPSIEVPANSTTPTTAVAVPTTSTTQASGPTTTARMSVEQTPITQEGSKTSGAGLIVFIVVVVVILGGAVILYVRHRNTGNTTKAPAPAPAAEPPTEPPAPEPGPHGGSTGQ